MFKNLKKKLSKSKLRKKRRQMTRRKPKESGKTEVKMSSLN